MIGPEGARRIIHFGGRICRAIESETITYFLQEIHLNGNDIESKGIVFLAAALKEDSRSLRQLFLSSKRMGEEGAAFEGEQCTAHHVEGGEGRVGTAADRAAEGLNGSHAPIQHIELSLLMGEKPVK